jgi:hypothetical protein
MSTQKQMNPGPLGLLGFGLATILLNIHNADFIPLTIVIIAMGVALGGIAQIIAGILEFKIGNTFGGTAFTAYGLFWLSLVMIWTQAPAGFEADNLSMGFYLLVWGLFTTFMFIGTLTHNTSSKVIFSSLAVLFYLLSIANFLDSHLIHVIAGYVGIFSGLSAFYSAGGQIVNQELGKNVFPL